MAIKGQKAKQPYTIAMKDRWPFGLGGIWENWKAQFRASGYALSQLSRRTLMKPADNIYNEMPLVLRPPIMRNG